MRVAGGKNMIGTVMMSVKGFVTRQIDRNLTSRRQTEIASQRLTGGGGTGMRAGDLSADRQTIMAQRGALTITEAEIEFILHPDLPLWVAKSLVPGSRQKGELIMSANVGSGLRFPIEEELLRANDLLGQQLDGAGCLVWASTPHPQHGESFMLIRMGEAGRYFNFPTEFGSDYGIRYFINKELRPVNT